MKQIGMKIWNQQLYTKKKTCPKTHVTVHATTRQLVTCLHATQEDNTSQRTHTMITCSKAQQNQASSKDNKETTTRKNTISNKQKK